MDMVEALLSYRNSTKTFLPILNLEKKYFILQILINLRIYITYNENIASFNVFNMSDILLLDIGVFPFNMQGASHVRWGPCLHSMARLRVADGGMASSYRVAANTFYKQPRTDNKGW
jgi:hypothetical protein